jgi:hypothetical protein
MELMGRDTKEGGEPGRCKLPRPFSCMGGAQIAADTGTEGGEGAVSIGDDSAPSQPPGACSNRGDAQVHTG